MTKTDKKAIAHALRCSMMFLGTTRQDNDDDDPRETRQEYICYALGTAEHNKLISKESLSLAKIYISDRLGHHATLDNWVYSTYPESRDAITKDYCEGGKKMQATRAAWVWSMINELEDLS